MPRAQPLRMSAVPYLAETVGTFGLVFAGPGAAAVNAASGGSVTTVGVGIAFGLAVTVMIMTFGHISGCHINPAVTAAFAVAGRIPAPRAAGYIAAQLVGAVAAAFAIVAIVGETAAEASATVPTIGGVDAAFWSEVVLTFFLVLVIFAVATDARANGVLGPAAIGGFVGVAATGWGAVAGASLNPARSFGPALATGTWDDHWVYWVAPVAAALLAAGAYQLMRPGAPDAPVVADEGTGRGRV